jgi:hypothetical protein
MFAHARKILDFDHLLIVAELNKVVLPSKRGSAVYRWVNPKTFSQSEPRQKYVLLCQYLTLELLKRGARGRVATRRNHERREKSLKQLQQQALLTQAIGAGTDHGNNPFMLAMIGNSLWLPKDK